MKNRIIAPRSRLGRLGPNRQHLYRLEDRRWGSHVRDACREWRRPGWLIRLRIANEFFPDTHRRWARAVEHPVYRTRECDRPRGLVPRWIRRLVL